MMSDNLCECGCGQIVNIGRRFIKGHNRRGMHHTDAANKKNSVAHAGSNNPNYGKQPSEETKKKIGDAQRGEKNHMFGQMGENHHNYGKPMSGEQKRKLSIAHTGKKLSDEHREKMSVAQRGEKSWCYGKRGKELPWYGRKRSDDTRRKMSEAQKGKNPSLETRIRISCTLRGIATTEFDHFIKHEPYCYKFNNAFKESVREAFGRVCFLCQMTEEENGKKLSVHHVNYNKNCLCDEFDCEFVPLCISCHCKTHYNREYWETYILKKLGVIT